MRKTMNQIDHRCIHAYEGIEMLSTQNTMNNADKSSKSLFVHGQSERE